MLQVSREDEFRGLLTELRERYEAVVSEDSDNDDFNPRPQQTLVVDSHPLDKEKQNTDRSIRYILYCSSNYRLIGIPVFVLRYQILFFTQSESEVLCVTLSPFYSKE